MTNNIGNYTRHAEFWDWSGHDRTAEHEHWYKYATQYGKNVLIPFCAWGETGAFMAERGMNVTAFDVTPEMIAEGKKRFGNLPSLQLFEGNVTDFCFNITPVDFCYAADFGHIHSIDDIKKALVKINNHLRYGGGFVIEAGLPAKESRYIPTKTFYPVNNPYPDKKVWKTGDGRTEAETGRHYISQTVYVEGSDGSVEQFEHSFYLQSYSREEWLSALRECGFEVKAEYRNREKEPWQEGDGFWICEAVKSDIAKQRYGPAMEISMGLQHIKINLEKDRDYIFESHCLINYECDTPWARKIPYEEYRANWYSNTDQTNGFMSALCDSMKDERTIAEIIKTENGDTVGYFWVPFYGDDASFIWADVQDIYIEPEYRRRGVAKALMEYAENEAKRNGAKVIRSGTGCENTASQRMHQKAGYYQYRMEYEKVL